MFKSLFDFGYKRSPLQALGFCIIFFVIGAVIAITLGALEYFLFSGHKYRHVISGGQFVVLVEIWVLSCLIVNAKRLYKNPAALLLMALSAVACIFSGVLGWIFLGLLTTLNPLSTEKTSGRSIAKIIFRSLAILIPVGFVIYDFAFVGVIPAIGLDAVKTVSYVAKHPDALKRRDEIAAAQRAFSKVRFKRTPETAERGYEFALVCAKYGRLHDANNLLGEININDLDSAKQEKAQKLYSLVKQYSDRQKNPLPYFSSNISNGYCTENSRSGMYSKKDGNYASAAESYKNSFETIGCNRMMDGFDLVDVFEQLGQYKDALFVIDQIIADEITNENGVKNMQAKKQEILAMGEGSPEDGRYHERYEKFKVYRAQFLKAKKIDAKLEPSKAEEELLLAVKMSPTIVDVVRTRLLLANVYDVSGQYEKALSEIQWLKENLGKVNDRMLPGLDWNEWVINQHMKGGDITVDPIIGEVQKLLQS